MYPYFNNVYDVVPPYATPYSIVYQPGYNYPNTYAQLPSLPIAPQPEVGKLPNLGDLRIKPVLKTVNYEPKDTKTYCDVSNVLHQLDDIIYVLTQEIESIAKDRIIYFYHKNDDEFNYSDVIELTNKINERTSLINRASTLAFKINESSAFSQDMIGEYHSIIEVMNGMTLSSKFA